MTDIITAQGPLTLANHKAPPAKGSVMGDNLSPYEAIKAHVDDLEAKARNHLDGEAIQNEAQAEAVQRLKRQALEARKAAEAQRKEEARPFDEGKAAVQALWTPITDEKKGRCALIVETCGKVLAPWLEKLDAELRAAAEAARLEAEEKAAVARQVLAETNPANLADRQTAEQALKDAAEAQKAAVRADRARPLVGDGESRRTGLRKATYRAEITNPTLFARWAWEHRRGELLTCLDTIAQREAKQPRPIPGIKFHEEERRAV